MKGRDRLEGRVEVRLFETRGLRRREEAIFDCRRLQLSLSVTDGFTVSKLCLVAACTRGWYCSSEALTEL